MKKSDVDNFEKTNAQLEALHQELILLVKKSPDNPINKFKLKIINGILTKANEILGETYIPLPDFLGFDEDELPTTSDITLVIAQYLNCMEKLRADNIKTIHGYWVWLIGESEELIRTAPPKKITERK